MISQKVAIIPARGGSRRIRAKNLADFGGRPAIVHVIDTTRASGVFDRVFVSTDEAAIAEVSRAAGADVVERPAALADDRTSLMPVVTHTMRQQTPLPAVACLIMATAVFLTARRLRAANALLDQDRELDYVIGVKPFESPPQRALSLSNDGRVSMLTPGYFETRSQDLQPLYLDAGQFSMGRAEAWLANRPSFTARTRAVVLGKWETVDIDEPEDLAFARELFTMRRGA